MAVSYLLDTNIILALMRWNALGKQIDQAYGLRANLNRSLISVVSVGELLSLTRQLNWGRAKVDRLNALIDQLIVLDINEPSILDAYGEVDSHSRAMGRKMGKNDVWIAATARAAMVTLLTTDADFDHLDGSWINRIKIDPQTGGAP